MNSIRLAAVAALAIAIGSFAALPDTFARPDDMKLEDSAPQPLARGDLKRSPEALRKMLREAPKPSDTLKKRELVARALAYEFQVWMSISNSYDANVYARYVARFPRGLFTPLARARAMYLLEQADFRQSLLGSR